MDVPHPETAAPAGADGHDPAARGFGALAVAEAAVPAGAVTQAAGPTDVEWDARIEALLHLTNTDAVSAREQAQAALGELRGQHRLDLESRLTWLVGYSDMCLERPVDAVVQLHRAVGMAQTIRRADLEAHHLATLGYAHANMFAFAEAIECFERALSLHQSLPSSPDNDLLRARVLGNFATTFILMGRPESALPLTEQARELFMRLGSVGDAVGCLGNRARAEVFRAEKLQQQSTAAAHTEAAAAARAALELAAQVLADPALETDPSTKLNARLTIVQAHAILGECAEALEELERYKQQLPALGQGSGPGADYLIVRARLLRLTGRTTEAIAELQSVSLEALPQFDRVGILDELVSSHEALGDFAGALTSFRRYHELTLQARDQSAEQRGQVLNARLELERAQHKAEIERLRAEQLTLRNEELARQAHIDALTGLPNRRGLDAALAHRIGEERARFACVLADIDHFKRINDRYSHLVGDEVLRRVRAMGARSLRCCWTGWTGGRRWRCASGCGPASQPSRGGKSWAGWR